MYCGLAAVDGTARENEFHQTCRGNGDGKYAKLTSSNTGSPQRHAPSLIVDKIGDYDSPTAMSSTSNTSTELGGTGILKSSLEDIS